MARFFGGAALGLLCVALSARADIVQPDPTTPNTTPMVLPQQDKIEELQQAVARFQAKDVEGCLALLETASAAHPDLPPAGMLLARLYFAANQLPLALRTLDAAAAKNPDNPLVYQAFAEISLTQGLTTNAMVLYEKAMNLGPMKAWPEKQQSDFKRDCHAGLAAVAERREQWPDAEKQLRAAMKLDPENAFLQSRLGRTLFEQQRYDEAAAEFTAAAQRESRLDASGVVMAALFESKGEKANAEEWMAKAVAAEPDNPQVHIGRSKWLLGRREPAEARKAVQRALELKPDLATAKMLLGVIARDQNDYATAEKIFEELHLESPADIEVSRQLSLVLIEQPEDAKKKRAVQLAEINLRQYPRSPDIQAALGWIYYRLGRNEQAAQALQQAANSGKMNAETQFFIARFLGDRGMLDNARQLLTEAVRQPGYFVYRDQAQEWLDRMSGSQQPAAPNPPEPPTPATTAPVIEKGAQGAKKSGN